MEYTINQDLFTLYFTGELNSSNAELVEKDIEETLLKKSFKSLVLDFSHLTYISSAGLRIILKLKQKYHEVTISEASLEVYDVLSMTGFTNIMEVKKALKRVDISHAEVIGSGYFSTVYRIDKDTIIKVFNRVSDPEQIERELKLAKQAFVLGIPTAISFDIVRVDDKLGVRFEMLDCMSLKQAFIDNPKDYDSLVDRYVSLLKKINSIDCEDPSIPSMKSFYLEKLEKIKDLLGKDYYAKAQWLIDSLPDAMTFVHGDCHFKNIMVQGDELLLIDMDTLSHGEPIFELAQIMAPYVAFDLDDPGNAERFLGVSSDFASKLFNDVVNKYLGKDNEASKEKIAVLCYLHMVWWTITNEPKNNKRIEGNKKRLLELLDKYNDLKI